MIEIVNNNSYWVFLPNRNLFFTKKSDLFKGINYQYESADLHSKKDVTGCYELKISYWVHNVTVDVISCTWVTDNMNDEDGWTERRTAQRLFKFNHSEWEEKDKFEVIKDAYVLYLDYFRDRIVIKER